MFNHLCNEYGLDTMSAGSTIAWAMECYEEGVITRDEFDGIAVEWGNADAVIALLHKIGKSEGCGQWLKLGTQGAANYLGRGHEFLVVASGIEEPQHDSRWAPGRARMYKYDPTPGRHVKGGIGMGQGAQPAEVKHNYNHTGFRDALLLSIEEIANSSGTCSMSGHGSPPGMGVKLVSAVTGFNYSPADAYILGLRIFHMRNAFNLREGFRRKDFTYSDRGIIGPEYGPLAGVNVDVELLADNLFNAIGLQADMLPERAMLQLMGGMEKIIEDLLPPPPPPPMPAGSEKKEETE